MTRILTASILALVLGTGAALASGNLSTQQQEQIRAKLTAQGYDVRKIESEDGMIEVYALKDGARLELYLDADFNIIKTKIDD
ncbi:PepSY domain-containing protein [Tropicibacter oceani]|uniref:PepSY domain-containing protein n=1 Tax=Tropicibacter oceani TaxID=3058420 RepID=A0ABY8QES4_9RHOB|nr:PepSY domain-containing protein [Tropicibacter oceani]WGW03009.1 PepSY domain-containing protein [Tropicibacter oceani]